MWFVGVMTDTLYNKCEPYENAAVYVFFSMALIENKKLILRFAILETFQAGIELTGGETKAVRSKLGSLEGARVVVRAGEAYLVGATIPPYQPANTPPDYDPEHARKLLLKKKEIIDLAEAEGKKGLTIVPIEMYNAGRYIKVRVGIVRGKGKFDKREDLKKKAVERDLGRTLKNR
jgi:SsrA-binding protein